jgi:deoxyinosine 3'endonuclease (endonuclease V)
MSISFLIVDGYAFDNKDNPTLGQYVKNTLNLPFPVIGVAKSLNKAYEKKSASLYRGRSNRPLYISSIGIKSSIARDYIARMAGSYRIPTLLNYVNRLSKH